jgi:hypothetical protein
VPHESPVHKYGGALGLNLDFHYRRVRRRRQCGRRRHGNLNHPRFAGFRGDLLGKILVAILPHGNQERGNPMDIIFMFQAN